MCRTPWCFGDCEECELEKKREQEHEETSAECPYRKECNLIVISNKSDKCTSCGIVYNY